MIITSVQFGFGNPSAQKEFRYLDFHFLSKVLKKKKKRERQGMQLLTRRYKNYKSNWTKKRKIQPKGEAQSM